MYNFSAKNIGSAKKIKVERKKYTDELTKNELIDIVVQKFGEAVAYDYQKKTKSEILDLLNG